MAKKKPSKPDLPAEDEAIRVPIEWHYPEGMPGRFANHVLVQHDEHEYHISFFEIQPPVVVGSEDERWDALSKLKSVRAECVARIIISKGRMPGVVEALQQNLERHQATDSNDSRTANGKKGT